MGIFLLQVTGAPGAELKPGDDGPRGFPDPLPPQQLFQPCPSSPSPLLQPPVLLLPASIKK